MRPKFGRVPSTGDPETVAFFRRIKERAEKETPFGDSLAEAVDQTAARELLGIVTVAINGWDLVVSTGVGTGATLDFEEGFDAGYDHLFTFNRVYPDVADVSIVRVKEAGSWKSGATDYRFQYLKAANATFSAGSGQAGYMLNALGNTGAASAEGLVGDLTFIDPANTSHQTTSFGSSSSATGAGATLRQIQMFNCEREAAATCEGVRFLYFSGNNFAGGTIAQYRRKNV